MMEYIYHYTTIDALEQILKSRKFRLSSLAEVDDTTEQKTKGFGSFGRFLYVSSWTSIADERAWMWHEYSDISEGIRLGINKPLFRSITGRRHIPKSDVQVNFIEGATEYESRTEGISEVEKKFGVTFMTRQCEFYPVTYTDNKVLLDGNITNNIHESGLTLDWSLVGRFKDRKIWAFQEELRYSLLLLPFTFDQLVDYNEDRTILERMKMLRYDNTIPCRNFDLPINPDALESLSITTSPLISQENFERMKNLVQKYCPSAQLFRSKLILKK
ncbi:hypothetical protein [Lacticaseibacillus suihuaensis]